MKTKKKTKVEKEKYFLITQNFDYADEFNVNGFFVIEAKSKDQALDSLVGDDVEFPVKKYFGTNECLQFNDVEEFFDGCDVQEITKEQSKMLEKMFGSTEFGHTFILV